MKLSTVHDGISDELRRSAEAGALALMQGVADALNACERAGVTPILDHNAACTEWGYVLHLPGTSNKANGGHAWQVRTRQLMPPPEPANELEQDDLGLAVSAERDEC
jgi:hypothetical protein